MNKRVLSMLPAAWLALMPTGPWTGELVSSAQGQVREDIEIELEQFGVGSAYRPGDFAAIRLRLTSNLDEAVSVWVQWEVPNADGDIGEYGRSHSLTVGRPTTLWLYAPLLPEPSDVWSVRVFEERDGERQKELGALRIESSDALAGASFQVPSIAGMIAVIGRRRMGLDDFRFLDAMMERPYSAHEQTLTIAGLTPGDCPDRWFGWLPYEAVVWGSYDRARPADLGTDRAEALRAYVFRGGHLVIVLPDAGNPWGIGQVDNVRTELSDLLPQAELRRDVVKLRDLLAPLSKIDESASEDMDVNVQVFKELRGGFDVIEGSGYQPLIALEDGRVIVVQKVFGHGRITLVGVDVSSETLQSIRLANGSNGLPQADAFWNRILGRRADMPIATEVTEIKDANRLSTGVSPRSNGLGRGGLVSQQISMTRKAAVGLLLALVLFVVYFVVAGPGGFALLKQYKRSQHAWLAFAGAAAAFTAIAWGAVSLMPSDVPDVQHLTILDHVARPKVGVSTGDREPQLQRAISYFSVYLDEYRKSRVAITPAPGQRDLLHSWTAPGVDSRRFPNVDHYRVDISRSPADIEVPARSTATQMVAYWSGGVDPDWGGMMREDLEDPIQVIPDTTGREQLSGSISHSLPSDLTDVTVFWVTSNRVPRRLYFRNRGGVWQQWVTPIRSGLLLNNGYMGRIAKLQRNVTYSVADLIDTSGTGRMTRNIHDRYVKDFAERDFLPGGSTMRENELRNYMEMLSIYHQLTPPPYLLDQPNGTGEPMVAFTRELGRQLDLSPWFTRPCLIIIGYLEDSPLPIPLRLQGNSEQPSSEGRTMYRWIFPLPLDENIAFPVQLEP